MGNHLRHVILTTGRVHQSERSSLADAGIAAAAKLLNEAFDGHEPLVPGTSPSVSMAVTDSGRCLSVLLRRADAPLSPPVVTIGIAGEPECGPRLWRWLHAVTDPHELATTGEAHPPEPWCAERQERARVLYVEGAPWRTLQEFECCIAWAFLDQLSRRGER